MTDKKSQFTRVYTAPKSVAVAGNNLWKMNIYVWKTEFFKHINFNGKIWLFLKDNFQGWLEIDFIPKRSIRSSAMQKQWPPMC